MKNKENMFPHSSWWAIGDQGYEKPYKNLSYSKDIFFTQNSFREKKLENSSCQISHQTHPLLRRFLHKVAIWPFLMTKPANFRLSFVRIRPFWNCLLPNLAFSIFWTWQPGFFPPFDREIHISLTKINPTLSLKHNPSPREQPHTQTSFKVTDNTKG